MTRMNQSIGGLRSYAVGLAIARDEAIIGVVAFLAAPAARAAEAMILVVVIDLDAGGDADRAMLLLAQGCNRQQFVAAQGEAAHGFLVLQAADLEQPLVV